MLEVHQFAQEAVVAESWLSSQEAFLVSQELGGSVDEVEQLIRRHEAFRKAAAAWEERFSSLRRLTTVSSNKASKMTVYTFGCISFERYLRHGFCILAGPVPYIAILTTCYYVCISNSETKMTFLLILFSKDSKIALSCY